MKSKSITSPMLNLPFDTLSEIALRLPTVKSTKPWRDVNSLATTCKVLSRWKKEQVNRDVKNEWNKVQQKIPELGGWQKALVTILGEFENPDKRLYLEPVLRKIARYGKSSDAGNETKSYLYFITQIFLNRETVSLTEIHHCFSLCKKLDTEKKIEVVQAVPSLLPALESKDRQEALRLMFKLLYDDKDLGKAFMEMRVFNMQAMFDDPTCHSLMVDHLNKLFSNCETVNEQYNFWKKLSFLSPALCKSQDGNKLFKKLVNSFLEGPLRCRENDAPLSHRYMKMLCQHITLVKIYFGKAEKELLCKKLSSAITYSIKLKHFEQSTSLLIELAKVDAKLFGYFEEIFLRSYIQDSNSIKIFLQDSLACVDELSDSDNRGKYIFFLKKIAHKYFGAHSTFFKEFKKDADNLVII